MPIPQYGRAAQDAMAAGVAIAPQQYNYDTKEWEDYEPGESDEDKRLACHVEVPEWSVADEEEINRAGSQEAAKQYAGFCEMWRGRLAPQDTARMCATGGGIAGRARAKLDLAQKRGMVLLPAVLGRTSYEEMAAQVLGKRHSVGREIAREDAASAIRIFPALKGKILIGTFPEAYL